MVEEVLQQMGGRCCNGLEGCCNGLERCCNGWAEGVATDGRGGVATDGQKVLQQTLGDRCNKRERWVRIATDGRKVLQQTGEVGRERCNRTLRYFTVDGLP